MRMKNFDLPANFLSYLDKGALNITCDGEPTINFHVDGSTKIIDIIDIAEKSVNLENLDIEVEYQSETIGKYGLSFSNDCFHLTPTFTDCLAKEKCGIPINEKPPEQSESCCNPSSGCC